MVDKDIVDCDRQRYNIFIDKGILDCERWGILKNRGGRDLKVLAIQCRI